MDAILLQKIATEFNQCLNLKKYQHLHYKEKFVAQDLMNGVKVITNRTGSSKLSKLFFRNYIPQSRRIIYHHFTTIDALKSIIKSENLRLSSVSKRFAEKEFKPFYKAHEMDGYAKRIKNGEPLEKDLCNNSFFLSLTGRDISADNAEYLASAFSKNNNGVRLVFSIKNVRTDLRKVFYPINEKQNDIPLLSDFLEIVRNHKYYLIVEGISKFGFFYLPGILSVENEYRLLVSRGMALHHQFTFGHNRVDNYEFLNFPLFNNPIVDISLQKVIMLDNSTEKEIKKALANNNRFSSVSIERYKG